MSIRLHNTSTGQTDRQTDRWKCHNNIALCMQCMVMHDKNLSRFIKGFLEHWAASQEQKDPVTSCKADYTCAVFNGQ